MRRIDPERQAHELDVMRQANAIYVEWSKTSVFQRALDEGWHLKARNAIIEEAARRIYAGRDGHVTVTCRADLANLGAPQPKQTDMDFRE